jgi:hypothetical protein
MPEDGVHPLEYEPPRPQKGKPSHTLETLFLGLALGLLAGGLGAAIDPSLRGAGPVMMGVGGFFLGIVLPVPFGREESE